jgi:hypothetical protein
MSLQLNGDTGVTFNDASLQGAAASPFGLKNKIINGDMQIDQRNTGASVSAAGSVTYTLDRWFIGFTVDSKYTVQQNAGSVTPPVGFVNYAGITSSSAYSVLSSDSFDIRQRIEGLNVSDLAWGTANAKTVTLSFWVRSSLTGTFGGSIKNSAGNRSYPFTYTISSANTWEQKTVTVAGDTSGTWLTTNGIGLAVIFGLGAGSTFSGTAGAWAGANYNSATGATSVVGTNGATFYITGVQLERNTTATPFEYIPYGTELALCQRYFVGIKNDGVNNLLVAPTGVATSTADVGCMLPLLVEMRAQPSISGTSLAVADSVNPVSNVTSVTIRTDISTTKGIYFGASGASGLTTYRPYYVRFQAASSGSFNISAEL